MQVTICTLAIFVSSSIGQNGFSRKCVNDVGCTFSNSFNPIPVFLKCENGACTCKNPDDPVPDVTNYHVQLTQSWCVVDHHGPCGNTSGLNLVCDPTGANDDCGVDGICHINDHAVPEGESCHDNLECRLGLLCIYDYEADRSYCRKPSSFTFDRKCENGIQCTLKTGTYPFTGSPYEVRLVCGKEGKCLCDQLPDLPWPNVKYNLTLANSRCLIAGKSPCGTDNGITLNCADDDKQCVKSRCLSRLYLGVTDSPCDDAWDCENYFDCVLLPGASTLTCQNTATPN